MQKKNKKKNRIIKCSHIRTAKQLSENEINTKYLWDEEREDDKIRNKNDIWSLIYILDSHHFTKRLRKSLAKQWIELFSKTTRIHLVYVYK